MVDTPGGYKQYRRQTGISRSLWYSCIARQYTYRELCNVREYTVEDYRKLMAIEITLRLVGFQRRVRIFGDGHRDERYW